MSMMWRLPQVGAGVGPLSVERWEMGMGRKQEGRWGQLMGKGK